MVNYIAVPRDLTKVKNKVTSNLTKRQLICFSLAALIEVPSFFLLKKTGNIDVTIMRVVIVMMPLFFTTICERDGEPLEVTLFHFIQANFIRPRVRIYQTDSYYAAFIKQTAAEKEVEEIVRSYYKPVPGEGKEKLPDSGVSKQQR